MNPPITTNIISARSGGLFNELEDMSKHPHFSIEIQLSLSIANISITDVSISQGQYY
jgi:hypothetical protein